MPGDPAKILDEIQALQSKATSIVDTLEQMKQKAIAGGKITAEELQLAVKDINNLDMLMRERQDVGH